MLLSCEEGVILIRGRGGGVPIRYATELSQNLLFLAIFVTIHWPLTESGLSGRSGHKVGHFCR